MEVKPEEQEAFEPSHATEKLNLMSFPGLHYICGACETNTIPDKEAGLLKRLAADPTNSESQPEDQTRQLPEQSTGDDGERGIERENIAENIEEQSIEQQDDRQSSEDRDQIQAQLQAQQLPQGQLSQGGNQNQVPLQLASTTTATSRTSQ